MAGLGWIKLHREAAETAALRNATRRGIFDRMLLKAAWRPRACDWRGRTLLLVAGQLPISVRDFAEANDLSYKELRIHLDRLDREGMIRQEPILGAGRGAIGTLITIVNFTRYQELEDEGPLDGAQIGAQLGRSSGAAGAQLGRTNKEEKEGENLEKANPVEPESRGAPPAAPEPARAYLWREMKVFIGGSEPGALIGRWCRDYGEGVVIAAYFEADRVSRGKALACNKTYMAGILKGEIKMPGKAGAPQRDGPPDRGGTARSPTAVLRSVVGKLRSGAIASDDDDVSEGIAEVVPTDDESFLRIAPPAGRA